MNRTLKKLVILAPYDVWFEPTKPGMSGWFSWGNSGDTVPYCNYKKDFKPSITIDKNDESAKQVCTLVHEIGHAKHYQRKCKCYIQNNRYLRELHATRFELRFLLRYKLKSALKYAISTYQSFNIMFMPELHQQVAEQIRTEKIWQKALDFVK